MLPLIKGNEGEAQIFALVYGQYPMRGRTALGVCEVADPPDVWMTLHLFKSEAPAGKTVKNISQGAAARESTIGAV